MKYAVGVTSLAVGGMLVYAGFLDVNLWDTFLNVLKGTPATTTATATPTTSSTTVKAPTAKPTPSQTSGSW